jgi:hypothetical protein
MLKNYSKNEDGLIYQINKNPIQYNQEYVEKRYDSYGELTNYMSYLRLGYISGVIKEKINSILDVGYGNGTFLKVCKKTIPNCYGYDVTNYQLPHGVEFVENWIDSETDVTTFFDVIEHLEDPYIVKNLKTKYIVISVPWCHYESDEWFENWKHRRPNEHLWHFNESSMENFANSIGFELMNHSNFEDNIRGSLNNKKNILTVCLKNKKL